MEKFKNKSIKYNSNDLQVCKWCFLEKFFSSPANWSSNVSGGSWVIVHNYVGDGLGLSYSNKPKQWPYTSKIKCKVSSMILNCLTYLRLYGPLDGD